MDPHAAVANMLGTVDLEKQVRRVGYLEQIATLAMFLRGSQTEGELGAHLGAIVDTVGTLKWLVGTEPFPGMPK